MLKKLVKIALALALALLLFVLTTALLTQMPFVHSYIGRVLGSVLEAQTGVSVSLGRLHGNLWQYMSLDDIVVQNKGDTLFTCRDVTMIWNPWALFRSRLDIRQLGLEEPHLHIRQLPDGSFNLPPFLSSSSGGRRFWQVIVDTLWIHQGGIGVALNDRSSSIPRRLSDLTVHAHIAALRAKTNLALYQLYGVLEHPHLRIIEMHGNATQRDSILQISDLLIKTEGSLLRAQGEIVSHRRPGVDLHLTGDPVDAREVEAFIPGLALLGRPMVDAHIKGSAEAVQIMAMVEQQQQSVILNLAMDRSRKPAPLDVRLELDRVDPADWWPVSEHASLTGSIHAVGHGWQLAMADWAAEAKLRDFRLNGLELGKAEISATLANQRVKTAVEAMTPWGRGQALLDLALSTGQPVWSLETALQKVDLARLFSIDTLASDLNLSCTASGQGLTRDLSAQAVVRVFPSTYNGYPLDSLTCHLELAPESMRVSNLSLISPITDLNAQGTFFSSDSVDFQFNGMIHEPNPIRGLALADTLHARGPYQGTLKGPSDSLTLNVDVRWSNIQYDGMTADSIIGYLHLAILSDSLDGHIDGIARRGQVSIIAIDSIRFANHLFSDSLHTDLHAFVSDSIQARSHFTTHWDQRPIYLKFPFMHLQLKDQNWYGGSDSSRVVVKDSCYYLNNLELRCEDQRLSTTGFFSWTAQESLAVDWSRIEISQLNRLYDALPALQGDTFGRFLMTGTADDPEMTSQVIIGPGRINGLSFSRFDGRMSYGQEKMDWQTVLHGDGENRLYLNFMAPMNLALTNQQDILYPDRPFFASLQTHDMDLSFISQATHQVRQVQGRLDCDIRFTNTLRDPRPAGFLRISGGKAYIPQIGKTYSDIQLEVNTDSSRLRLDHLRISSGDGTISGSGSVNFVGSGLQTQLHQLDLTLRADQFNVIDTRDKTLVMNGRVRLSNSFSAPHLDGDILVVRSRFNLPSVTSMGAASATREQPLLMTLRQDQLQNQAEASTDSSMINRLKNVHGSIKVEIPRNTWLRSPEMNLEISGKLNILMDGAVVELFGVIEMMRGDYSLYGRRFEIESGTIAFQGGREINPVVDLKAQHVFRSADKIKRVLRLQVRGELREPKLSFLLDDIEIAETDAIAYLLFGMNFDALTQGQRTDMAQDQPGLNSDAVKDLVAGQLAGQVTRVIRNSLDLDVIEFKGDNNWRQATVVVGKYITNDLFLSYQREIKMGRTYDTTPEQVTLEYEITRSLFFQAVRGDEKSTGLDLIWKYEK